MTAREKQIRSALLMAEQWLDSQMSPWPKPPKVPMWKVLEAVRAAKALVDRGPTLNEIDAELAEFP